MDHDDCTGLCVELRPASSAHHLQHVGDREVDVSLELAVVVLRALDDHQVRGEVDPPRQSRCRDQDHDLGLHEELLDDLAVALGQAGVVDADAVGEGLLEAGVRDPPLRVLELVGLELAEELGVLVGVRRHEGDDVQRGEPGLAAGGYEDERRLHAVFLHSVVLDRMEARLVHLSHSWDEVLLWVALDVRRHRHRPHGGLEVEEPDDADAEPVRDVVCVRQGRAEANEADLLVQVARDVPHPRDDDLQHGPAVLPQEVDLVDDDEADLPHVRAVLPMPRDAVPLLGGRHDDVGTLERVDVGREVACKLDHGLAKLPLDALLPILHALSREGLQRCDVDDLLVGLVVEQTEHGQLGHDGLPAPSRCAHQDVVVCVVASVETLRLDRVEVRKLVQTLEVRVVQRGHRDRGEIQ
mmetsp:Transcript_69102/g.174214  ORF Transcript_69102/g.174214 Transcript_69102/m.174214 type:complete len:411 (+) Transcript_69102:1084-2316(+)